MSPISLRATAPIYRSVSRVALFVGIALFTAWATFTSYSAKLEESKELPGATSSASRIAPRRSETGEHISLNQKYGKLPLSFEVNTGQTDPSVKYFTRGPGYNIFFTAAETVLVFPSNGAKSKAATAEEPNRLHPVEGAGACRPAVLRGLAAQALQEVDMRARLRLDPPHV
ncbi:MAG: hypothetical protein ABJB97_10840, partial [Acidobacteriota bacterium]